MVLVGVGLVVLLGGRSGLGEWAHGRSGSPYTQLGAIGGMAYVAAVALIRRRS
jgi:hypothetical protein